MCFYEPSLTFCLHKWMLDSLSYTHILTEIKFKTSNQNLMTAKNKCTHKITIKICTISELTLVCFSISKHYARVKPLALHCSMVVILTLFFK